MGRYETIILIFLIASVGYISCKCVMRSTCYDKDPYSGCHPIIDEWDPVPINYTEPKCPQYSDLACCSATANLALTQAFGIIDSSFGTYCPSCGMNIKRVYCQVVCSPNQHEVLFPTQIVNITAPNGTLVEVLEAKAKINKETTCQLYDSCKSVPTAQLAPSIGASASNFFRYQASQGEQFGQKLIYLFEKDDGVHPEILPCFNYTDPDSHNQTSCPCMSCEETCKNHASGDVHVVDRLYVEDGFLTWNFSALGLIFIFIFSLIAYLKSGKCLRPRRTVEEVETNVEIISPEIQSFTQKLINKYSNISVDHPYILIFVSSLICIGLSIINLNLKIESDPNQIWVNPESKIYEQKLYYESIWGRFYRLQQIFFSFPANKNDTLIQIDYLKELHNFQQRLLYETTSTDVSFQDLCYHPIKNEGCMMQSPLDFWRDNLTRLYDDDDIQLTVTCQIRITGVKPCFSEIGVPVNKHVVFGWESGLECGVDPAYDDPCDTCIPRADKFVLSFLLDYKMNPDEEVHKKWEKNIMIGLIEELNYNYSIGVGNMTAVYLSERTISDEVVDETSANILIVVLSYLAMFIYVCLALGKFPHPVYSRVSLSIIGIIGVLFSASLGFAFCALVGYKVTLIVTDVLPFLILAIGVDSIFIIVKEYDIHVSNKELLLDRIKERISLTLAAVFPSISGAVICEICAFLLGLTTGISALKIFCISASICLIVNYVLLFTFFIPCLVLDSIRQENNNIDLFCCFKAKNFSEIRQSRVSNIGDRPDTNLVILERLQATNEATPGKMNWITKGDFIRRFNDFFILPLVTRPIVTFFSTILFIFFFVTSIIGLLKLELGLDQTIVLPSNSQIQDYFYNLNNYGQTGALAYMLMDKLDYHEPEIQNVISKLNNELENNQYVLHPVTNWINGYMSWINTGRDFPRCPEMPPYMDEKYFYLKLQEYVDIGTNSDCCQSFGVCGGQYMDHIKFEFDENGTAIGVENSRLMFQHSSLVSQDDFIMAVRSMELFADVYNQEMLALNKTNIPEKTFVPFAMFYVYFGQYDDVLMLLFRGFLVTICLIALSSLIITNPVVSLLTLGSVFFTVVDVIGVQYWWNKISTVDDGSVQINAIFLVTVLNSIGLSVEFIIHIASAYYRGWGTREEKVRSAVSIMGSRVLAGIALTKLCGLIVLYFARARVFKLYFYRIYIMVVFFGTFHGLIYFPSLLNLYSMCKEKMGEGVTRSSISFKRTDKPLAINGDNVLLTDALLSS